MIKPYAAIALTSLFAISAAQAGDKELVEYREHLMEVIGGHMSSIVAIVKREVPYKDELAYHADSLAAAAPRVLASFETKAMTEDSEALAEIWDEWDAFAKAAKKLETTSADFAAAVASGKMSSIGPALGAMGKSCKGCHDDFAEDH